MRGIKSYSLPNTYLGTHIDSPSVSVANSACYCHTAIISYWHIYLPTDRDSSSHSFLYTNPDSRTTMGDAGA